MSQKEIEVEGARAGLYAGVGTLGTEETGVWTYFHLQPTVFTKDTLKMKDAGRVTGRRV